MKRSSLMIITLVISLFCWSVSAQEQTAPPKTPKIAKKQIRQQARIKQGVQNGELTKGETESLEKEQGNIRAEKLLAKSDGKVTPQERQKIRHDQRKAGRHIYRAKHNDNTRAYLKNEKMTCTLPECHVSLKYYDTTKRTH